ncbi:estradiol 17-beta-dehydrogenase 11-like [Toxorhynchites rutilus septentrionalis]|uniref:estradiol 17-beta-dehydrogenase 11-like n=1 Tax=Toxorhynchites rutilus septentrionalis TaxID=329112 RepID=UPI0024795621|nr:estradiol 17-beta-dehydrogenase 11-like [Toxorhynchites rutilus septentrionalis]
MAYHEQYFSHADGSYVPASIAQTTKEIPLSTALLDGVTKVIKLLVLIVPVLLRDFVQLLLPAQKKSIKGQVALVTGGGNGLGRALCLRLAQEGCAVAVADIDLPSAQNTAKEVRNRYGVNAEGFRVDVADHQSVAELRKRIESALGPVDILVNNAGLLAMLSLSEGSVQDVQRIINVNLLSHFWTIREFKDGMVERRRGHIVAISSILGILPNGRSICYNTTKFGVRGLMASLNDELYSDGLAEHIHTTCVYPAGIKTRKDFVDFVKDLKLTIPWHSPEYVAEATVTGMLTNKTDLIASSTIVKFLCYCYPLFPKSFVRLATDVMVGKCPPLTRRSSLK